MNAIDMGLVMQSAVAGFLATYAHLMVAEWAPRFGLPRLDFPRGLAQLTFGPSYEDSGLAPYTLGLIALHLNGILFTLIYSFALGEYLPGDPLIRGLIFAGILLAISQLVFVPFFLQDGFFGVKVPYSFVTGTIAHVVFGLIIGWLAPIGTLSGG